MKNTIRNILILIILAFLFISCATPNRYISGSTTDLKNVLDSIERADMILFPDTTYWRKIYYNSNLGIHKEWVININGIDRIYIMTINKEDSLINYNYRVERK